MVSSIRAVLLKGLSSTDPVYTAVDDTAKELKERIQQIHTCQKESACGTGISPARVEMILCTLECRVSGTSNDYSCVSFFYIYISSPIYILCILQRSFWSISVSFIIIFFSFRIVLRLISFYRWNDKQRYIYQMTMKRGRKLEYEHILVHLTWMYSFIIITRII